jgi:hypothetical protein
MVDAFELFRRQNNLSSNVPAVHIFCTFQIVEGRYLAFCAHSRAIFRRGTRLTDSASLPDLPEESTPPHSNAALIVSTVVST